MFIKSMDNRKLKEQLDLIRLYLSNPKMEPETYFILVRLLCTLEAILDE